MKIFVKILWLKQTLQIDGKIVFLFVIFSPFFRMKKI